MAPVFDAASQGSTPFNGQANSFSWSHAGGTGTDRYAVAAVSTSHTVSGVTYGGVAMTQVGAEVVIGARRASMWRLFAPLTGTRTVNVTLVASSGVGRGSGGCVTFTGADQGTVGTTATATGTSTAPTVDVAATADDVVVGHLSSAAERTATGAGQTERWHLIGFDGTTISYSTGSTEAGAATVTSSWTLGSSADWTTRALVVKGAAAVTTASPATVATSTGLPVPATSGGATTTPSSVATGAAVPPPSVGTSASTAPATVVTVAACPAPTITAAVVATPGTAATSASATAGSVSAGSTIALPVVVTAAAVPAPAAAAGAARQPATVATVAVIAPPTATSATIASPPTVATIGLVGPVAAAAQSAALLATVATTSEVPAATVLPPPVPAAPCSFQRPAVHPYTDQVYRLMPEHYRDLDRANRDDPPCGWPLLRMMSLVGDQGGEVADLVDRIGRDYNDPNDTAELVDPELTEDRNLRWLAQHLGIPADNLSSGTADTWAQIVLDFEDWGALVAAYSSWAEVLDHGRTVAGAVFGPAQLREAIRDPSRSWKAGSRPDYRRLLEPYLTGNQRVVFRPIFEADAWHLRIETYASETTRPEVIEAVLAGYPHAAGLSVSYAVRTGETWAEVIEHFATWSDVLAAFATWSDVVAWTAP